MRRSTEEELLCPAEPLIRTTRIGWRGIATLAHSARSSALAWSGVGWTARQKVWCSRSVARWGYPTSRSSDLVPPLYLVGRVPTSKSIYPRLGGRVHVLSTIDPREGWSWVLDEIEAGRPSLVWGDIGELPYLRVQLRMSRHDIVVIGHDEGRGIAFVVDNDRARSRRSRSMRWLGRGPRSLSRTDAPLHLPHHLAGRAARRGGSSGRGISPVRGQYACAARRRIVDLTTAAAGAEA